MKYCIFVILFFLLNYSFCQGGDFFNINGTITGRVYIDENDNGCQDEGENGIEGVKIILENSVFVTTGIDGKYSIPDLPGGFHVLELDDWSLPPGFVLVKKEDRSVFVNVPEDGIININFRIKEDL